MGGVTIVVGASPNPARYAYETAHLLVNQGYDMLPMGIKPGKVAGKEIVDLRSRVPIGNVDTITLYIGPQHQPEWYEYLLSLRPRRIIFNPGAENPQFEQQCEARGVQTLLACTLVMLRTGQY